MWPVRSASRRRPCCAGSPCHWPCRESLAGFALAMLTCMKELPATLLLRPTGLDTLATRLWSQTDVVAFGSAAPYAVLLVLLAGLPTLLLTRVYRVGERG